MVGQVKMGMVNAGYNMAAKIKEHPKATAATVLGTAAVAASAVYAVKHGQGDKLVQKLKSGYKVMGGQIKELAQKGTAKLKAAWGKATPKLKEFGGKVKEQGKKVAAKLKDAYGTVKAKVSGLFHKAKEAAPEVTA